MRARVAAHCMRGPRSTEQIQFGMLLTATLENTGETATLNWEKCPTSGSRQQSLLRAVSACKLLRVWGFTWGGGHQYQVSLQQEQLTKAGGRETWMGDKWGGEEEEDNGVYIAWEKRGKEEEQEAVMNNAMETELRIEEGWRAEMAQRPRD